MPYDARLQEALEACEIASKQNPKEPRLQYQLARVLEFSDRKRAFAILQKLTSIKYPAAYDNIGWIYLTDQNNPQEAVNYFRKGVELNDSDSMVSLAAMYDRNHTAPRGPGETKLALYHRAAQLGNNSAVGAEQLNCKSKVKRKQIENFKFNKRGSLARYSI